MALTKIRTGGITADAVDNTILKLDDDFALTGTVTGAGVSTATSTLPSEGGAATTIVAQGLLKAWVHAHEHDAQDSFNIASQTDGGTGVFTFTFTNGFSSVSYCAAASNQSTRNGQGLYVGNFATGNFRINPSNASGSSTDYNTTTVLSGDLA